jgi:hypothetical protein
MINFSDYQDVAGPKYIQPGVHEVTIREWSLNQTNPMILELVLYPKGGSSENGTTFRFYFTSEASIKIQLTKIRQILNRLTTDKVINELSTPDNDLLPFVEKLNEISRGRSLRMLFGAREYVNQNGETKVSTEIPLYNFSENIESEEAEVGIVNETRLVYNPDDPKIFKRLPKAEAGQEWGS